MKQKLDEFKAQGVLQQKALAHALYLQEEASFYEVHSGVPKFFGYYEIELLNKSRPPGLL